MRPRTTRLAAAAAVVLAAGVLPSVVSSTSSAADPAFRPVSGFKPSGDKVRVSPERYTALRVDLPQVRADLADGELAVPTPTGGTRRFTVTRTDVLAPDLAAAHPEIATYSGQATDDPTTTIALDVTPMGFHAAVRGAAGQGAWYVDPAYDKRGTTTHLAFYGSATTRPEESFAEKQAPEVRRAAAKGSSGAQSRATGQVVQKRYRLALTSDPSYAAYFGTDNVLAEKATLISRVNQIYGQDLAISLQLINETDDLNFDTAAKATGPDGPCGGEPCFRTSIYPDGDPADDYGDLDFCSGETLARNRLVLGQVIGAENYDIGHIALGNNGGGVAYLGVVGADYKGGGCTGLPEPKGDFFAIDYVAHEMGHQFAGNHTFNGVQNACSGGNRNGSTSVEPGSGSSVMAYAGICRQDDLQAHTDPYFSFKTLDEVNAYTGDEIAPVVEVQTVSLSGFGGPGSGFTLSFGGSAPVAFTPANYNADAIETAVETATGQDVTIAPWGYDPYGDYDVYPAPIGALTPTGFQVIFAPTSAPDAPGDHQDVAALSVTGTGGVTTLVGETAKGGAADNGGFDTATTADKAPTVEQITAASTLPIRTPFRLTGKAVDPDGDKLTYLWEQADRGLEGRGTLLIDNKKVYGPLFRVFGKAADVSDEGSLESPAPGINKATSSGARYFPDLQQVLSGNTNARTGRCPGVSPTPEGGTYKPVPARSVECFSEFLPTKDYLGTYGQESRVMHFRLTARDGRGGVGYRNLKMRVDPRTGPFVVTSQARSGQSTRGGSRLAVRWAVNGTDKLSSKVRIYLSTDGGSTWDRTLSWGTANDGYAVVKLPTWVRTSKARIIVHAASNYFYSVNAKDLAIR
jgi:hypothetical protein